MKNVLLNTLSTPTAFQSKGLELLGYQLTPARETVSVGSLVSSLIADSEGPLMLALCGEGLLAFGPLDGFSFVNMLADPNFPGFLTRLTATGDSSGGRSRVLTFSGVTVTPAVVTPSGDTDGDLVSPLVTPLQSRFTAAQLMQAIDDRLIELYPNDRNNYAVFLDQVTGECRVLDFQAGTSSADIINAMNDIAQSSLIPLLFAYDLEEIQSSSVPSVNFPVWG